MQPYFARPRFVYSIDKKWITYPCKVTLNFYFKPEGIFGVAGAYGTSAPEGSPATLTWDAFQSKMKFWTDSIIPSIELQTKFKKADLFFVGNVLRLVFIADSKKQINALADDFLYCFPSLLSLEMTDVPSIYEVRGTAGDTEICYGLNQSETVHLDVINKQKQENRILDALNRMTFMGGLANLKNRRLLAALQYFYISCRLQRTDNNQFEFLAEAILNYGKILETLFPVSEHSNLDNKKTGSIDATRNGLKALSFPDSEIESLYVPALALRNSIDVAHPTLGDLPIDALVVLQGYTDLAEGAFRKLLQVVFKAVQDGIFQLKPVVDNQPSRDTLNTINRLKIALAGISNKPHN